MIGKPSKTGNLKKFLLNLSYKIQNVNANFNFIYLVKSLKTLCNIQAGAALHQVEAKLLRLSGLR